MFIERTSTRQVSVGQVKIGGGAPVVVQSMTNTDTSDLGATVSQIRRLEEAGCEVVRVALLDLGCAKNISKIKSKIGIPIIADIHFDHRLALLALDEGVDGLRINPGNIGSKKKIEAVIQKAGGKRVPIRIGVNAGSLEKDLLKKYGHPTPDAMVESALRHIAILEEFDFHNIKVSLKASNVIDTIQAYRIFSRKKDYPLHIGISEAGTTFSGTIKSSIGLGMLLAEGIGDTIRVSLTADPVEEVKVAYEILKSLGIRKRGINIISCPTCGRSEIDVERIAREVEMRLSHIKEPLNISILGCVVNGIGEGKESHLGIAGGKGKGILFKNGKVARKIKEEEMVKTLVVEAEELVRGITS
jgi:(E)-4-hydroxy-3-methylbut-2-enyl-diphosphate synthase